MWVGRGCHGGGWCLGSSRAQKLGRGGRSSPRALIAAASFRPLDLLDRGGGQQEGNRERSGEAGFSCVHPAFPRPRARARAKKRHAAPRRTQPPEGERAQHCRGEARPAPEPRRRRRERHPDRGSPPRQGTCSRSPPAEASPPPSPLDKTERFDSVRGVGGRGEGSTRDEKSHGSDRGAAERPARLPGR